MENFKFDKYDFKRNLLFTWPTGTWKTYKAKFILKDFKNDKIHDKLLTYNISDAEFKQFVKSNMLYLRKPEDYLASITIYPLEMMLRAGVLLFDDIGVSDVTDAYLRDFTYIIDKRIDKGLTTIFTTNLKKSELKEKLNERIVSRILFNTDVIVFTGEDRRLKTTKYFNN